MVEGKPVVVCGKSVQIATGVIANLKPEYEAQHLILNQAAGEAELPYVIQGQAPPSHSPDTEGLGSRDYSRPPLIILLGAGYDDEAITKLREACAGKGQIPWLRPDTSKPAPPLGPEYGKALVNRVKELLKELEESGKMNQDGVHWY